MNTLELVSHRMCPYVQRAAIALDEKGVPFERIDIDLADKPDWFKAISPLGKVPLLRVDGQVLFESAVICEYLDETLPPRLHPDDPLERARHRAWVEFGSSVLSDIAGFYAAGSEAAMDAKQGAICDKLDRLEAVLGNGPYFAGARFCLVDAAFGPVFRYFDAFEKIADFGFLDGRPKTGAWRVALKERPSVRRAVAQSYPQQLAAFLSARGSHLSSLMPEQLVARA